MRKIFNAVYKFFAWFAITKWWCFWSNLRFSNSVKDADLGEEDRVKTNEDIRNLSVRVYKKFTYTQDGSDQLWDAIVPPAQNYIYYIEGALKDDCDGFHATLYHCLRKSGILCYLLSVVGIGTGHCLLIYSLNGYWYVLDYTKIYDKHETIDEAVSDYCEAYKKIYDGEILYNSLVEYDYFKGKFISVRKADAEFIKM